VRVSKKTVEELKSLLDCEEEIAIMMARTSLHAFTKWTNENYKTNWHHKLICDKLDQIVDGGLKRLMIFTPPRHGKSELVSRRFPAYLLGRNPKSNIISASYSADLASSMNRDVQRIMDSAEYAEIFPESSLNKSNVRSTAQGSYLRNSDVFEVVGHGGVYLSAGVGGGITGRGANYAIIDDPIKNQEEADSHVYREKVWNWYASTLYTRLQKPGVVILTLTRWHEDDLAGRLLALAKADPKADQWEVLNLPARYEQAGAYPLDPRQENEPLWNSDFGDDTLNSIRASVGPRVWNALYQQRPSSIGGNIVQRVWWKTYKELPALFDQMIISADLTFKDGQKNDFAVFQVWGRVGSQKYLIDQVRARMGFTGQLSALKALSGKWPDAQGKYIEDAANGAALVDFLKKDVSGLIAVPAKGSKIARAEAIAPQIEAGNVFLPEPSTAPWINDYIEEWAAFPNGMNDDQVDATSQALKVMSQSIVGDWAPMSITKQSRWSK